MVTPALHENLRGQDGVIMTSMISRNYHKSVITKPKQGFERGVAVLFVLSNHMLAMLCCDSRINEMLSWLCCKTLKQWQISGQTVIRRGEGIHLWHQVTVSSIYSNTRTTNQSPELRCLDQWEDGSEGTGAVCDDRSYGLMIMWSGPDLFLDLASQSREWFSSSILVKNGERRGDKKWKRIV